MGAGTNGHGFRGVQRRHDRDTRCVLFSLLVKHVPSRWLLGPGIGAMIVGLVLVALTRDYGYVLMLVMLISAGASVVTPMITYWASIGGGLAQGAALGEQTAASGL